MHPSARRVLTTIAIAGAGTLALTAPAGAALYGHWHGASAKATIKLTLRPGSAMNEGSLLVRNTSPAGTAGHVYEMRCHAHGAASGLVFAIEPLTGSNPINLSGASGVRGPSCTITRDGKYWTTLALRHG
jgi:hypothetical protein